LLKKKRQRFDFNPTMFKSVILVDYIEFDATHEDSNLYAHPIDFGNVTQHS
jgi:hypothetical protein